MNVFILNTGRCGSTTFIRACSHIENFTAAHESRVGEVGPSRLSYPPNHIEADNRLSWFLGRLDLAYGDRAFYVHLTRDRSAVVKSFVNRFDRGIIRAYKEGVLWRLGPSTPPASIAADYCETVEANIALFLKDKPHQMRFDLENAIDDFATFWERVGAQGDREAALREFTVPYNATKPRGPLPARAFKSMRGRTRRVFARLLGRL